MGELNDCWNYGFTYTQSNNQSTTSFVFVIVTKIWPQFFHKNHFSWDMEIIKVHGYLHSNQV